MTTQEVVPTADMAEEALLDLPQTECPVEHQFAPGVYLRSVMMPAGTMVVGHQHKTEHFNIIMSGRALVSCEGKIMDIKAPFTFVSGAGVRKVLLVIEDMVWQTVHCVNTSDMGDVSQLTSGEKEKIADAIAPLIIKPSAAWDKKQIANEMKLLREEAKK